MGLIWTKTRHTNGFCETLPHFPRLQQEGDKKLKPFFESYTYILLTKTEKSMWSCGSKE